MKRVFSIVMTLVVFSLLVTGMISADTHTRPFSIESERPVETPNPTIQPIQKEADAVAAPDIVGGQDADQGEYPWQVRVNPAGFLCGGALIDDEWVLTAAHCVFDQFGRQISAASVTTVVGDHRQNSSSNDGTEQVRSVSQVIPHPDYSPAGNDADVALLRLSSPVTLIEGQVETIVLNSDSNIAAGTLATVTGWGTLFSGGNTPTTLQEVSVPIVSNQVCNSKYGGGITGNMICAGLDQGGKDSCQGDSGGPLIAPLPGGSFEHIGVVSFGIGCADGRFPGVYARTSEFVEWIETQTGPLDSELPTATPTSLPTATFTPSPTNTPPAGATSTITPTPSNTPSPTPIQTPTESTLLQNGFFDDEPLGTEWTESSTQNFPLIGSFGSSNLPFDEPPSAPNFAWLGGADSETSILSQVVSIPESGRSTLEFAYFIGSNEATCGSDIGRILFNSTIVAQIDLCTATETNNWIFTSLDLSAFAGQNVTLSFQAETNFVNISSFYLDSLTLVFEEDQPTLTPTPSPTPFEPAGSSDIQNGDFEAGDDGSWIESSSSGFELIYNEANNLPISPSSGSYVAWLGGANSEISTLSQQVDLGSNVEALQFEYW
ncbi:MAG: trypsin-like serine protease, partial [Chloroflexota bacterium]